MFHLSFERFLQLWKGWWWTLTFTLMRSNNLSVKPSALNYLQCVPKVLPSRLNPIPTTRVQGGVEAPKAVAHSGHQLFCSPCCVLECLSTLVNPQCQNTPRRRAHTPADAATTTITTSPVGNTSSTTGEHQDVLKRVGVQGWPVTSAHGLRGRRDGAPTLRPPQPPWTAERPKCLSTINAPRKTRNLVVVLSVYTSFFFFPAFLKGFSKMLEESPAWVRFAGCDCASCHLVGRIRCFVDYIIEGGAEWQVRTMMMQLLPESGGMCGDAALQETPRLKSCRNPRLLLSA